MRICIRWIVLLFMGFQVSQAGAAPIYQLGFVLDASGSVSTANYNLMRTGLNNALEGLPTDGSVEITVTSYSSSASTVVAPTLLTAASLPGIQAAVNSHSKSNGNTDTAEALVHTTDLMTASAIFSDPETVSLINLMTDGEPNSTSAALTAADYAWAAGIDALSIEAIGSGVNNGGNLDHLADLAFPGAPNILGLNQTVGIPNPIGGSWVIPVSDFDALGAVLAAKVIASVTPPSDVPEPASSLLLLIGLAACGLRRRVQMA